MKLKNIILLTGILLPVSSAFAQYTDDALLFSQSENGTTSRFTGLGGAQTALGGDASSIASNPAGLGLFTRSEFSFTPAYTNNKATGNYLNKSSTIQKDRAGINQVAVAFYNPTKRYDNSEASLGWLSVNMGIAYNKTNNFNGTTDYGGVNQNSSFGDYLADIARDPNDALADAGYNSFLIEQDEASKRYFPLTDVNNTQQNTVYKSGSQSEVNFSIGANYSNQFYLGASIGLASINYNADKIFTESGMSLDLASINAQGLNVYDPTKPYLDGNYMLSYSSNQETKGTGVNGKIGLIYRAAPSFRVGLSFATPTWYSISDTYSEGLNNRYNKANGMTENLTNDKEYYEMNYTLRTPYRINGGAAYIVNNIGLITADVEFADYTSIHFNSDEERETTNTTNNNIRDMYQSAVNFKVGAEVKLDPIMLRVGYNTTGNPYQNASYTTNTISGGFGYRINNVSFDLSYASIATNYDTRPYNISNDYPYYGSTGSGDIANIKNRRNNVFATIGLRF